MRPHLVPSNHYLLGTLKYKSCPPPKQLSFEARTLWTLWGLGGCDGAVIVTAHRKCVAFLRFNLSSNHGRPHFQDCGTWVAENWRGGGLAFRMWEYALRRFGVRSVIATTTSPEGRALIASIIRRIPDVTFEVE